MNRVRILTTLTLLTAFVTLAGSWEPARAQANYTLTTGSCPVCTPDQIAVWQFVQNNMQGVIGRDPVGHVINQYAAKKGGFGKNWYPVDVYKTTLCGQLHHYNFFDNWGAEADWNNFFIPTPAFAYLIDDVRPLMTYDDWQDCVGQNDCMEAEITPDENFYDNPWFPKGPGDEGAKSFLEGRTLCTYGPWVYEEVHGNRPEIHPSELYWWRGEYEGGTLYDLMIVQDDSNRFDRPGDFSGTTRPAGWRPWSAPPRTGKFQIAFEVNPWGEQRKFFINESTSHMRNVITRDDPAARMDDDDGVKHAIEYNGKVVLTADEMQADDDNIGVRFEEVCRRPGGKLQGYLALTSKVGVNDRGGEGYYKLWASTVSFKNPYYEMLGTRRTLEPALPKVRPAVAPNSLRRVEVNGKPMLVADISFTGGSGGSANGLSVSGAEFIAVNFRQGLLVQSGAQTAGVVKSIPVLNGGRLQLKTQSGATISVASPKVTLAPNISAHAPQLPTADASAGRMMAAAAGGQPNRDLASSAQLRKAREWQIDVAPGYAAQRGSRASREEGSPFSEELNAAIQSGNAARLQSLFGAANPFKVEWSFKATNLNTGANVSVKVGATAAANEIRVELLPGKVPNGRIKVTFPEQAGTIYELVATSQVTDTYGSTGMVQHRLWSHYLTGQAGASLSEAMLSTAANLAGVSAPDLIAASRLSNPSDTKRPVSDPRSRRARLLRLYAIEAADDNTITVGELRSMVGVARLFGGSQRIVDPMRRRR